jgi:hypothetical protein
MHRKITKRTHRNSYDLQAFPNLLHCKPLYDVTVNGQKQI